MLKVRAGENQLLGSVPGSAIALTASFKAHISLHAVKQGFLPQRAPGKHYEIVPMEVPLRLQL